MITFKKTPSDDPRFTRNITTVEMSLPSDATLNEMLSAFEDFLMGIGFRTYGALRFFEITPEVKDNEIQD